MVLSRNILKLSLFGFPRGPASLSMVWQRVGRHWTGCGCERFPPYPWPDPTHVYLCKIYHWCIFILTKSWWFSDRNLFVRKWTIMCVLASAGVQSILTRLRRVITMTDDTFLGNDKHLACACAWQHPRYFCFLTFDNSPMTLTRIVTVSRTLLSLASVICNTQNCFHKRNCVFYSFSIQYIKCLRDFWKGAAKQAIINWVFWSLVYYTKRQDAESLCLWLWWAIKSLSETKIMMIVAETQHRNVYRNSVPNWL